MRAPDVTSHRWLKTARKDLDLARLAADAGFHAHACFHAHQGAEKAVKSIHYARGARMVLGHSIRQLIERLNIPSLGVLLPAARQLDLFYIPTRYPNGLGDGTPDEAFSRDQSSRAVDLAHDIIVAASDIIADTPPDR